MSSARTLALVVAAGALAAACKHDEIEVRQRGKADYNRRALLHAIDQFDAARRSAGAYGKLAAEVERLRPGMDETVAAEAELQLVVLALGPIEAARAEAPDERARALATTVWSVGLAGPIEAPDPQDGRARRGAPARPGEDAGAYLVRLCGGPLALVCQYVVPEHQAPVVEAEAIRRFARRAERAVSQCQPCASEPGWTKAVTGWDALERETHEVAAAVAEDAMPGRWPVAGTAAGPWQPAPLLEVAGDGGWIVEGQPVLPDDRRAALKGLRAASARLRVHVLPAVRADLLAALIDTAGAAGFGEVEVEARAPAYPWTLRGYRLATGRRGRRPPWHPVDTVQVLLRAIDAHVAPGAIAHL
jgi:hypothetical protein